MTEIVTKYLPEGWMDEVCPEPQADVNVFIHRQDDGSWLLRPVDDDDFDGESFRQKLEPGTIVKFYQHEFYGWHTLDIDEDGNVSSYLGPKKANCFCLDNDMDGFGHSFQEIAENGLGEPLEPGSHSVTAYWWSEPETAFRFDVIDGKGQFTRLGMTQ